MTKLSILNLVPKYLGESYKDAYDRALKLAQFADKNNFQRYWLTEHHNSPAVISSATEVVISYILAHTKNIRIGAGGVMLPNHSLFQVAERYACLNNLYKDRIDLGLGRAPGTDKDTARLLYKKNFSPREFINAAKMLKLYFSEDVEKLDVKPYPQTREIPLYILGTSTVSAHIAGKLGLPYAFAGQVSPDLIGKAFDIYRTEFIPSRQLEKPYTILSLITNIARTKEDAKDLSIKAEQIFLQLMNVKEKSEFYNLDPENAPELTSIERFLIKTNRGLSINGDVEYARKELLKINEKYKADEIMALSFINEYEMLEDNFRILKEIVDNSL